MMEAFEHVCAALEASPRSSEPYPFLYATDVFPASLYDDIQVYLDDKKGFHTNKFLHREFADDIDDFAQIDFMQTREFFNRMLTLFRSDLVERFGGTKPRLSRDVRLIRDEKNYHIGPHTDIPEKVMSLLFYLPKTDDYAECGTSVFVPTDPTFTCKGGPHYKFDGFSEVWRAPFLPNSCFGFWKTQNSFHGVHSIPVEFRRDVLLYNIYDNTNTQASHDH